MPTSERSRWIHLDETFRLGLSAALIALSPVPTVAQEEPHSGPSTPCVDGPLIKTFGESKWLAFACATDDAVVLVSSRESPAHSSYVILRWREDGLQIQVQGEGDPTIKEAARLEASKLSHDDFLAIRDVARSMGDASARSQRPPIEVQVQQPGLPETPKGSFPYPTVAAAREALQAKSDVAVSTKDGWMIAEDRKDHALWSFTPPGHPAYPAVVRRRAVPDENRMTIIEMRVLCESPKAACDQLVIDFKALNERIAEDLKTRSGPH